MKLHSLNFLPLLFGIVNLGSWRRLYLNPDRWPYMISMTPATTARDLQLVTARNALDTDAKFSHRVYLIVQSSIHVIETNQTKMHHPRSTHTQAIPRRP